MGYIWLFVPALVALVVITFLFIKDNHWFKAKQKPMLEQIEDSRAMARWESFFLKCKEDDKAYWQARYNREVAKSRIVNS